jgi:hypothetical protein
MLSLVTGRKSDILLPKAFNIQKSTVCSHGILTSMEAMALTYFLGDLPERHSLYVIQICTNGLESLTLKKSCWLLSNDSTDGP